MPLVGVSSLMAIAHCATDSTVRILAVKDAKRDEFYFGGFERQSSGIIQLIPDSVGSADELFKLVNKGYAPIGPGVGALAKYPSYLETAGGHGYDRDLIGGSIAMLGSQMLKAGKTLDLAGSIPNYIRVPKPREWNP
jgi:tRNA A37 threonylcarbamoyladenosine modification protein TsaB